MVEKKLPPIPIIDKERIGPEKKVPKERKDGLAQHIQKWWLGDAHSHSVESTREGFGYPEGIYDIEEILEYYEQLGLEFVCFTEHSSKPGSPEKQSPKSKISRSLLNQAEGIAKINRVGERSIAALSGVEANIMFDEDNRPMLDLPPEVLQKLDLVIASRHAVAEEWERHLALEKDPKAIKESLLYAVRHPDVDIIGHPDRYTRRSGEQPSEYWDEYWGIWPEIFQEMVRCGKAFEINLNSQSSEKLVEMAAKAGVKFFINYDAHDFSYYKWGGTELANAGEKVKKQWARGKLSTKDREILKEYKADRLSSGPGVVAILRLARWIKRLESWGVTPERVVNSSRNNLLRFLTEDRQKMTENLHYLTSR